VRKGWWAEGETLPSLDALRQRVAPETYWTYPLTAHQHRSLKAQQEGRCAICDRMARLVVDHCHDEHLLVRGMLCSSCNTGIGLLGDSADRLKRAAEYLERPILAKRPSGTRPPTRSEQIEAELLRRELSRVAADSTPES